MKRRIPGIPQLVAGAGGTLLIVSLFLPYASLGGISRSGWHLLKVENIYLLGTGIFGITAALTGGRFRLNPGLSVNGAADVLGVMASLLLFWLIVFQFPHAAHREVGVYLALVAALVQAFAAFAAAQGDAKRTRSSVIPPGANAPQDS
jgi:hypothetical protein